jgi:DNA-directed RNA polymerase subunit K/omega
MGKTNTSKTKTLYSGKKNIDISKISSNDTNNKQNKKYTSLNQSGGAKNKKKYNSDSDDSEYGSDEDDVDADDNSENSDNPNDELDDLDEPDNELDDLVVHDNELDNDDDNQSETNNNGSDDERSVNSSNSGDYDDKDDKNYIDNEETLKSKCYSKYAEQNLEDLDLDEIFGEETLNLNPNIKLSKPILTKYEFVRLLTDRTKQLAQGAKPMLKNVENMSSKEIAKLELKNKIIPLIIERPIPNSNSERWKLSELEIPDHLFYN